MIRYFLYTIARILITALAIYVAFLIIKFVVRFFIKRKLQSASKQQKSAKPKEKYSNVQDVKFVDVDKKEEKSEK